MSTAVVSVALGKQTKKQAYINNTWDPTNEGLNNCFHMSLLDTVIDKATDET